MNIDMIPKSTSLYYFNTFKHQILQTKTKLKYIIKQKNDKDKKPFDEFERSLFKYEASFKRPYFNFFYSLYLNDHLFIQKKNTDKKYLLRLHKHYIDQDEEVGKVIDNFFREGEIDNNVNFIYFFRDQLKYMIISVLFLIKYWNSLKY